MSFDLMPYGLLSHREACDLQHAAIIRELEELRSSMVHRPSYQSGISRAIAIVEATPPTRVASLQATFWALSQDIDCSADGSADGDDHRQALVDAWALAGDVVSGHRCEVAS